MEFIILGVGSSFSLKRYHTNFILKHNEHTILIDAGTTLRYSLEANDIPFWSISHIFITHFHHDHVGGLSELLLRNYWLFDNGVHTPKRIVLIIRKEQLPELEGLLAPSLNNQNLTWRDYCEVQFFEDCYWSLEDITFQCIITDDLHCEGMPSYALKINTATKNLFVTGDIKDLKNSHFLDYINEQTIAIVQDISLQTNPLHASLEEALAYYPTSLHEKVLAVHYDENTKEDDAIQFAYEGQKIVL